MGCLISDIKILLDGPVLLPGDAAASIMRLRLHRYGILETVQMLKLQLQPNFDLDGPLC